MTDKLTDYEYSILDEIRRDEINQAIDKSKKWDKFENEDPDATISILDNIKLEQQIKQLKEELDTEKTNTRIIQTLFDAKKSEIQTEIQYLKSEKQNIKEMAITLQDKLDDSLRVIGVLSSKNKKYKKVIDEISELSKFSYEFADTGFIKTDELKSILKEVEE